MGIITEVLEPSVLGARTEDRPDYDPDLQVCELVNSHRADVLRAEAEAERERQIRALEEPEQMPGEFRDAEIWEAQGTRGGRLACSLELLLRAGAGTLIVIGISEGWVTPILGTIAGALLLLACGVRFWEARHGI